MISARAARIVAARTAGSPSARRCLPIAATTVGARPISSPFHSNARSSSSSAAGPSPAPAAAAGRAARAGSSASASGSGSASSAAGWSASLAFALGAGAGLCALRGTTASAVDLECSGCDKNREPEPERREEEVVTEEGEGEGMVATAPARFQRGEPLPGTTDASAAWVPPDGSKPGEPKGLLEAQKRHGHLSPDQAFAEILEEIRKEQKEADDGTPHWVPEHVKEELMGALDHSAELSSTARYMLGREALYPVEHADLTFAPEVPKPIRRNHPVHMIVDMLCVSKKMPMTASRKYEMWPFGVRDKLTGKVKVAVPGPMIRARVGDVLQVNFTNEDESGMAHSIDFHSVCGPGGGSPTNFAEQDETKTGAYLLRKPGLYIYHCAAAPIPVHLHNGMFGLILVEPPDGMPPVDKEFYVVQHEVYAAENDDPDERDTYDFDYQAALDERPRHIFFNGREGALVEKPMMVEQNDRVRIYFGNAGPNLISSVHLIGGIFDRVYREGDLVSPPAIDLQSTMVPAGAATVLETQMLVPGSFSLIDHSIFRIDKGAVGMIKVKGKPRPDVYDSLEPPVYCPGCKTHQ